MTPGGVRIARLDPRTAEAAPLLRASESLLRALYPPASTHIEDEAALARPNVLFLGAWSGEALAGCGAVKRIAGDVDYGEVKRLFVAEPWRRHGIGAALMQALEAPLRDSGAAWMRLETGIRQPESLRLYRRLGYRERGPFGDYGPDPWSVFLEKAL